MSDDIKDDPAAPAFERSWLNEPEPDELIDPPSDPDRRRKVLACIIHLVNVLPERLDGLLYMEVLMALSSAFGTVAESALKECEFDTFHYNRGRMVELLGIMSGYLNGLQPTVEQLTEAPVVEIVH